MRRAIYRFEYTSDGEAFRVVRQSDEKATCWLPNEDAYNPEGGQLTAQGIFAQEGLVEYSCSERT